MALRNDETISELGKRLITMMEEQHYNTPKELAMAMYDQQLVHVKPRKQDNPDYDARISAIGSIEKKIVRHIKTGMITDDSGEYILAYCKILKCSSDYILCLTPIKSNNMEIRRVSEITGLQETVIQRLIENNKTYFKYTIDWWSRILSEPLFNNIPNQLSDIVDFLREQCNYKSTLKALNWELNNCPDDDKETFYDLYASYTTFEERLNSMNPTYQGMIYQITREFTDTLETLISDSNKQYLEDQTNEKIEHVKKIFKNGEYDLFNYRQI